MSLLRRIVASLLLSITLACGSPLEQQERSYSSRQSELETLAGKADAPTKAEISAKKDDIAKRYAALPTEKNARSEGLGKLCQELKAAIETYQPKVEAASKGAESAELTKGIAELAGKWKGDGVELTIGSDGSLAYSKKSANTSKSFTGKVTKMSATSFEAGALGFSTTFKIDKRPYDEGGKKLMVVDGITLTRQ